MSTKSNSSTSISSCYTDDSTKETKINKITEKKETVPPKQSNQFHPDITYAKILIHILNKNKNLNDYYERIEKANDGNFTYKVKPGISLLDYLRRIIKYTRIEFSTLILSMIYIDRICKEKVFLNEYNIHRLMFISIIMAYSYNEDRIFDNKYLCLVSGVSLKEMLALEHDFLDLIEFNLYVSNNDFEKYKQYFFRDLHEYDKN